MLEVPRKHNFLPHQRNSHRLARSARLTTQHIDAPCYSPTLSPASRKNKKKVISPVHDQEDDHHSLASTISVPIEFATKLLTRPRNAHRRSRNARLTTEHIDSPSPKRRSSATQSARTDHPNMTGFSWSSWRTTQSLPHVLDHLPLWHPDQSQGAEEPDGNTSSSIAAQDVTVVEDKTIIFCQDQKLFEKEAHNWLTHLEAALHAMEPLNPGLVVQRTQNGRSLVIHHVSGSHSFEILDHECLLQHSSSIGGTVEYGLVFTEYAQAHWMPLATNDDDALSLEQRLIQDFEQQQFKAIPHTIAPCLED